ncbi:MAG: fructose-bisphosphate aldolase [Candidatus Heimdallarchaeota archaeon]|nr:fructose-bisphosphate aldolase [Candidatus Heimdallarchaeota archaeon]
MVYWSIGKKNRIRRLIDETGAIIAVPMDHGYSIGVTKGLENINHTTQQVIQGGASTIIVQRGMVRSIELPRQTGLMVHVSGSTSMSSRPNYKILTGSVVDTIRLGADGISCHVNIGPDEDASMLYDLSQLSEEADYYNLPLLSMTYVRDNQGNDDKSVDSLSHAARVVEEAGADIVKIHTTDLAKGFDEVAQGINIPIIVAGGSKTGDFKQFLETMRQSILLGASGISIGRNVFQADNQLEAMSRLREVVHQAVKEVDNFGFLH